MKNGKRETQKTPKGLDIPIPKKADFDRLLKKAVKPSIPRSPKK